MALVAKVCFNQAIDESFSYLVSEKLQSKIHLYQRVAVNFAGEKSVALVLELSNEQADEGYELKPVERIIDKEPILNQEQVELANKVSNYYLCSMGEALFTMIPGGRRLRRPDENQFSETPVDLSNLPPLLPDQEKAVKAILASEQGKREAHLIFGVTGSGKTRIYIELIQNYLRAGLGSIFLLPEIALSYQFLDQLKPIFKENLAILHSRLTASERLQEYKRIQNKEAQVVVGTRSAIFAPVSKLGLIILDEEHDSSYKEHSSPKYFVKRIAWMRLKQRESKSNRGSLGLNMVLGSATPAIESYYLAKNNLIKMYVLKKRAKGFTLPEIFVPKHDSSKQDSHLFSLLLKEKIENHLKAKNQVLLLLNRRGHSNYAFCTNCEEALGCPNCSVTLTYHRPFKSGEIANLKCHLCGYEIEYYRFCKTCHGPLKLVGKGTQRVEENLETLFQEARFARLDQDSAASKDFSKDVLQAMRDQELDILIGTQIIAKGFDLPKVTLVGIINADIGLSLPDFRAPERVFQFLTQASGRAGRHQKGEVVIQTMQPNHYAIHFALNQEYEAFAEEELDIRSAMKFPPFTRLFRVLFKSEDENTVLEAGKKFDQFLIELKQNNSLFAEQETMPAEILGPTQAPIYKIQNKYRMHLIAKDNDQTILTDFAREIRRFFKGRSGISWELDLDPIDLL